MCPDGTISVANQSRVVIYTLGRFEVVLNGVPLRFRGRAPLRPLDLLTALVAAGEGGASAGRLADQLWPESDGFDAYRALTTALHRLRHLLRCPEAVRLSAGRLMLDTDICTVDAWTFERALRGASDIEAFGAVLDMYPGQFLVDDVKPWSIEMRKRLEQLVARKAARVANAFAPWKGPGLVSAFAS
jgi:DNA-binding SARP family transcriptional activator